VGAVLSFQQQRERIFLRWLSEVERLLGDQVERCCIRGMDRRLQRRRVRARGSGRLEQGAVVLLTNAPDRRPRMYQYTATRN
jgi:hypothetical protein